jgi:hypothetical protein
MKNFTARRTIYQEHGPTFASVILGVVLVAALALPAQAGTIYTYTGNAYDTCGGSY